MPEEGFKEDQSQTDIDYAKQGRKLIYRLIESVGESIMLDPSLALIHEGLLNQFWKAQYSAIMTLGEIIPFIAEPNKISDIIPICISACSAENPKVRFAGYTLIIDLSQNYIQEFQATYHNTIFPLILQGCKDIIPRVKAQALAALTSFIEGSGNHISVNYSNCIPYLLSLFNGQISLVIEYAITSISAFAKNCKVKFMDFYQNTVDELLLLLSRSKNAVYDNLRGRIVECISLCSAAVGKIMFGTKMHAIIQAVTSFEVNPDQEVLSYLLDSWQNICELLQEDFAEYLDNIVPSLLKFISSPNEGVNVNTTEVINKEHAMQTLSKFVEVLKGKYEKYLDDTLRTTLPYINYALNDGLRATAAEILASLVQAKKNLQDPLAFSHAQELAKIFLGLLVKASVDESNKDTLVAQLEAISKILDVLNISFLSEGEVNEIGSISLQMLLKKTTNGYNSDDSDILLAITEIIGSIFKSHPYFTTQILQQLSSIIIPAFNELNQKELQKYVLYIIDDAIEYLSIAHQTDKWDDIIAMLLSYANDTDDVLRQAAVYGLGVYAEKSANFVVGSPLIISALFNSLEIPSKRIKTYGHARDNSISAIGKIIKFQSQSIDLNAVIDKWFKLLPLKWDKSEAIFSHELLSDLLEWKSELILNNSQENFLKVLQIISDILDTKLINEVITEKFQRFLKKYHKECIASMSNLSTIQQEKIAKLL